MTNRYIDRRDPWLLSRELGFYGVNAPDEIAEEYFEVASAVRQLMLDLEPLVGSIADRPSRAELDSLYWAYDKFIKAVAGDVPGLEKTIKGQQLQIGRLKKQVSKLKEGS